MEDISRELLFVQGLEKIRRRAREQGNRVSAGQVEEAFSEFGLKSGQLQMVYDYLAQHKIAVGAAEEFLTEEEKDYFQDYLESIAVLPVPEEGELEVCARLAMEGDAQAKERLTESFLRDVADIAKLYTGQGVFLEDLIGEGNAALAMGVGMLGAAKAEPSEVRAVLARLVMDAMEKLIEENAANEKAERKAAERVNLVADKARELAEELRRKVTVQELSRETGFSEKAIRDAMRISGYRIEDIADLL